MEGIRQPSGRPNGRRSHPNPPPPPSAPTPPAPLAWWKLWAFLALLAVDATSSLILLTPLLPKVEEMESLKLSHYSLHGSLWDLSLLAIPRILFAVVAVAIGYSRREPPPESPFELYNKYGDKKSKEELENEALEQPFLQILKRYVLRSSFACELAVFLTGVLLSCKCLSRLNVEIGVFREAHDHHPLFWIAIGLTALFSLLESVFVDSIAVLAGALGRKRRSEVGDSWLDRVSDRVNDQLATPLLSRANSPAAGSDEADEESAARNAAATAKQPTPPRVQSDIGPDAEYSAKWTDLLKVCEPDKHLIMVAAVFLVLSSFAQVLVPRFTGKVLDSLVDNYNNSTSPMLFVYDADNEDGSVANIPGFVRNIELLVTASILGGVFAGIRGAIFSLVGARVNTRLRIQLMDSLLSQDVGFFDTTRTGDLSSRLGSDTMLVGMSVTSCVNIFLRSSLMVIGYLIFMASISWQLSILSFVTIPAISVLSKWYGRYLRRLARLQQKKLAEGSSVSESTISSMATVRAFGAESAMLQEFNTYMASFLSLSIRTAVANLGFSTCINALPELVKALVLFYGGLLVQSSGEGHITGGDLISFVLYLSALSGAFSSLGGIYTMLVRAVGAADKVFELMHRQPKMSTPSHVDEERMNDALRVQNKQLLGVNATKVIEQRAKGLYPASCAGKIVLRDVKSRYPARPDRVVLDGLNLTVDSGSVCAIVGASGSGKSSIVKVIQKLYEPQSGEVEIDGISVSELSPDWISRNVAVVQQEPTLFARSIKKNIIYGLEGTEFEPTQEEVEEAAKLANASTFIEALPQGYDSEVGERGIQLSGGQKQRVAIARALVRRPRILLLDEATSSLDATSELVVQQAIDNMINSQRTLDGDPSRSMTVVLVAHRLSTVKMADCIVVVKDGKVVERGTHEALVANELGAYSELIRHQRDGGSQTT